MDFEVPEDLHYLETHEWTEVRNGIARIGITDFAQDELGDIVFVELPDVGEKLEKGDMFGTIESIKAVSDLYTSVSGEVVAVNDDLENQPELINVDPFGEGWLIDIEIEAESELKETLSADEYYNQTK